MDINFKKGQWTEDELVIAYSFRFTETPKFTQEDDCIRTAINENHREKFDNISLLSRKTYSAGAKATLRCSFEDRGCPEIIIAENMEMCEDGAMRYGECFEMVLYRNGINIWRHYRENGKCSYYKRLAVEYPVAENQIHEMTLQVIPPRLIFTLDGQQTMLRVDDLPQSFHMGLTGCEGIARLYSLKIEESSNR